MKLNGVKLKTDKQRQENSKRQFMGRALETAKERHQHVVVKTKKPGATLMRLVEMCNELGYAYTRTAGKGRTLRFAGGGTLRVMKA